MKTQSCTCWIRPDSRAVGGYQGECPYPSIPGLVIGAGKCAYHWAEGNWGHNWASRLHPDHPAALRREFWREQ